MIQAKADKRKEHDHTERNLRREIKADEETPEQEQKSLPKATAGPTTATPATTKPTTAAPPTTK